MKVELEDVDAGSGIEKKFIRVLLGKPLDRLTLVWDPSRWPNTQVRHWVTGNYLRPQSHRGPCTRSVIRANPWVHVCSSEDSSRRSCRHARIRSKLNLTLESHSNSGGSQVTYMWLKWKSFFRYGKQRIFQRLVSLVLLMRQKIPTTVNVTSATKKCKITYFLVSDEPTHRPCCTGSRLPTWRTGFCKQKKDISWRIDGLVDNNSHGEVINQFIWTYFHILRPITKLFLIIIS